MVSAVVATRNRPEDLNRLIASLSRQGEMLHEIIIVDASDNPLVTDREHPIAGAVPIRHVPFSPPSLSCQRNRGIALASQKYILLCDDDLEFPDDYLHRLIPLCESDPSVLIVTGNCIETSSDGTWESTIPKANLRNMLWSWFFQLGLWKAVHSAHDMTYVNSWNRLTLWLRKYYANKGNSLSSAGWPLVTQVDSDRFTTEIFTLGGALFRTEWLKRHYFDEMLDAHGIGDNFDMCLSAAREHPVEVVTDAHIRHYRSPVERVEPAYSHARRVFALQYFLKKHGKWNQSRARWFIWSLVGQLIYFTLTGKWKLLWASGTSTVRLLAGRNPLLPSK